MCYVRWRSDVNIVCLLLLSCVTFSVLAITSPKSSDKNVSPPIEISVKPADVGEIPDNWVTMDVMVRNLTNKPYCLPECDRGKEDSLFTWRVTDSTNTPATMTPYAYNLYHPQKASGFKIGSSAQCIINPGKSITYRVPLGKMFYFGRSDHYTVIASLNYNAGPIIQYDKRAKYRFTIQPSSNCQPVSANPISITVSGGGLIPAKDVPPWKNTQRRNNL